ncbi:mucin-17 [Coccinella septempunctata]|uniref:mucin-17 n=1 Tax=Coccinella septempunctata TaxID=41139 RepID=UPI001D071A39|nr:mucin-17 [Coccinella septempunctata]
MVFMLRLISGLLIVSLYAVGTTEITTPHLEISNETSANDGKTKTEPLSVRYNTLAPYKPKPLTDQDVENIVKPFKFAKESEKNITSVKLKKSEPYKIPKEQNSGANRTNAGRSVDTDVDSFSTPVDHNAVYTIPDNKEYTAEDDSFRSHHSTEEVSSFENLGPLTTPKTPYFDQKFQETVDSLNKHLQSISESDLSDSTPYQNRSSDNFIDGLEETVDEAKLEYKTLETITNNNTTHQNKGENVTETRTTINYNRNYNTSTSYDINSPSEESNELHKEAVKHLLNDDTINEVRKNPSKVEAPITQNSIITTQKYSITKTSTERDDTAIISNRIEGETTATPLSTLPLYTNKPNRGSIKFSDYNKINLKTVSTSPETKPSEQTVEENQVVPVHVTAPNQEKTSVSSTQKKQSESITTVKTESVVLRNNTVGPDEHQSTTVYIFVQPEDMKDLTTTIRNEIEEVQKTSVASTPRTFQPVSSTLGSASEATITVKNPEEITTVFELNERTTAVTSIPRGFSLPTTTDLSTSTERPIGERGETTTSIPVKHVDQTTTEVYSTIEPTSDNPDSTTFDGLEVKVTSIIAETTTLPSEGYTMETTTGLPEPTTVLPDTTTEIMEATTFPELRSSKNIKFLETTEVSTTPSFETSTFKPETPTETATSIPEYLPETTTIMMTAEMTTKMEVTTEGITTVPTTTSNEVTQPVYKEQTSELVTKVIVDTTPTKTLFENETTEDKSTQETKTTPSTSFNFVHIKNIDRNHTTLTPDELKPNEIYTTPVVPSESSENMRTVTETPSDETTSSGLDGPSSGSGTVVAVIISCVGGICLIALACLLIVMRNRQNRFNYGQRCRPVSLDDYSVDNVSVFNSVRRKAAIRGSKTSYGNPAFEDPVCLSHPLNFPAISKFASNEEDVHAEFKDIPQIVARTSELPDGCETKNRYANVIPLPESRVFLNSIEGYPNSDYINANFVAGPKNTRKYYIACQAPMSNTVDDFWRMIWEQQCKVILMLTHLFENGIEKCFDYLPPSEVLDCHRLFGDYQVTLKKREVKEKYIISSIQLKNMVSNSWREVTHFWYMGWPEKGVPTEANSIIAFLIEARSFMKTVTIDKKQTIRNGDMNGTADVNPVVVHCSPGTGRTGAVITCDIAIREFEQTRQVDIPKIVYKIRRDRAGAVQTKEQYAFIYKVIDLYATKLAGGNLESI